MQTITAQAHISPAGVDLQKFAGELVLPTAQADAERLRIGLTGKLDEGFAGDLNVSVLGEGISAAGAVAGIYAGDVEGDVGGEQARRGNWMCLGRRRCR